MPRKHLVKGGGRLHSTEVAFLLLTHRPQVWFSALQKSYFDVAEIYQRRWFEESGPRPESVDQNHLVLGSGKLLAILWFGDTSKQLQMCFVDLLLSNFNSHALDFAKKHQFIGFDKS